VAIKFFQNLKSTRTNRNINTFHRICKIIKQIRTVMRPRRRLRMILYAEGNTILHSHSFNGSIIEIDVGNLHILRFTDGGKSNGVQTPSDLCSVREESMQVATQGCVGSLRPQPPVGAPASQKESA
jgi:hypothetical protein